MIIIGLRYKMQQGAVDKGKDKKRIQEGKVSFKCALTPQLPPNNHYIIVLSQL